MKDPVYYAIWTAKRPHPHGRKYGVIMNAFYRKENDLTRLDPRHQEVHHEVSALVELQAVFQEQYLERMLRQYTNILRDRLSGDIERK